MTFRDAFTDVFILRMLCLGLINILTIPLSTKHTESELTVRDLATFFTSAIPLTYFPVVQVLPALSALPQPSNSDAISFPSVYGLPHHLPPHLVSAGPPSSGSALKKRTDIRSVSDRVFLERASENTLEIYQQAMWNVESRYGPVIEKFEVEGTNERRVVIGYKMGRTRHIFRCVVLCPPGCCLLTAFPAL